MWFEKTIFKWIITDNTPGFLHGDSCSQMFDVSIVRISGLCYAL